MMISTAVLLAGGFGTRLQSVVSDVPKPLAPVAGRPFLDYQLLYLKHYGIQKVILSVGHLADKVISTYGSSFEGLEIVYAVEEKPLGTGGATRLALQVSDSENTFVLNGDSFFDVNLNEFSTLHTQTEPAASLAMRQVEDASRYGTIHTNADHHISSFAEKTGLHQPGLINGGIYILNTPTFLSRTPAEKSFSIEKDFFETQMRELSFKAFEFKGYFIDIGIPEDYQRAQHEFERFKYQ